MGSNGAKDGEVRGTTRRHFLELATLTSVLSACASSLAQRFRFPQLAAIRNGLGSTTPEVCDVVVIGSGFGGTLSAMTLAQAFKKISSSGGDPKGRVVMLERGQWWTTPFDTIQDQKVGQYQKLVDEGQPVQRWASAENFRGLFDVLTRCVRSPQNPGGLLEVTQFKAPSGETNPRLSVITSNGVGGGSLVYQNVTIQPPQPVLDLLPIKWDAVDAKPRSWWFDLARRAIGQSVLAAWDSDPGKAVNTGLSRIVARSAGLDPHFAADRRYDTAGAQAIPNRVWMNRPRLFHSAAEELSKSANFAGLDWGAVDLSINDYGAPKIDPTDPKFNPAKPTNLCERQGRCMIGCLPGARHTLNKQLIRGLWKSPDGAPAQINEKAYHLEVRARTEVLYVEPVTAGSSDRGGYRVVYRKNGKVEAVEADRVVVAAGTLGSSALLLRSKLTQAQGGYGTLPNLSDTLGTKFTNNGDYLAFLEGVKEPLNIFRGPNATSFIHVKPADAAEFHTLEDAGLPNVFSTLFSKEPGPGTGSKFIRKVAKEGLTPIVVLSAVVSAIKRDFENGIKRITDPGHVDDTTFGAEVLAAQKVMGVAGIGRDAACGRLTLTKDAQLRLHRTDRKTFGEDPAIARIQKSIAALAKTTVLGAKDYSPYADPTEPMTVGSLHPLGGCPIGATAADGVANDLGQVHGYDQLYIADGSLIGQSLGVNPSLTISALTLRIAKGIVNDVDPAKLRPAKPV